MDNSTNEAQWLIERLLIVIGNHQTQTLELTKNDTFLSIELIYDIHPHTRESLSFDVSFVSNDKTITYYAYSKSTLQETIHTVYFIEGATIFRYFVYAGVYGSEGKPSKDFGCGNVKKFADVLSELDAIIEGVRS